MGRIRAVIFDIGETLVDETRHWGEWADWMGVPRLTFSAALGVVIERRLHHHQVFELVRPGYDHVAEAARRRAAGFRYTLEPSDFYADARPCLAALSRAGYRIGLAGNQPEEAEAALHAVGVPADFIASSARWGVEKPDPAFFARVVEAAGFESHEIAYVGDRLDNDVLPAKAVGLFAVFIRRGPWGVAHASRPEAAMADARIEGLGELEALLAGVA